MRVMSFGPPIEMVLPLRSDQLLMAGLASKAYGGACISMRTIAMGEPLSMARIGSARPVDSARSMDPAVSCWASAALDWMNTRSSLRSSAAKYPLVRPI